MKNTGRSSLRTSLQYVYSIIVFLGVLITAYAMLQTQSDGTSRRIASPPSTSARSENYAPGLQELIEMEKSLSLYPINGSPHKLAE